eukprot:c5734_g1_i1.p1 GENE.c5734_g1_i1~~c5734_g1_i1.p1  ORF type:complete len:945 (+),score=174.35 c5734_g1_i1:430-3264(+)
MEWNGIWWTFLSPPLPSNITCITALGNTTYAFDFASQQVLGFNDGAVEWTPWGSPFPADQLHDHAISGLVVAQADDEGLFATMQTVGGQRFMHSGQNGWQLVQSGCLAMSLGSIQDAMVMDSLYGWTTQEDAQFVVEVRGHKVCRVLTAVPSHEQVTNVAQHIKFGLFVATASGKLLHQPHDHPDEWRVLVDAHVGGHIVVQSLSEVFFVSDAGCISQFNGATVLNVTSLVTPLQFRRGPSPFIRRVESNCANQLANPIATFPLLQSNVLATALFRHHDRVLVCVVSTSSIDIWEYHPNGHSSRHPPQAVVPNSFTARFSWLTPSHVHFEKSSQIQIQGILNNRQVAIVVQTHGHDVVSCSSAHALRNHLMNWNCNNLSAGTKDSNVTRLIEAGFGFTLVGTSTTSPHQLMLCRCGHVLSPSQPHGGDSWKDQIVIYQISTKMWTSPFGAESGTFQSTAKRMQYLASLGVTLIWLDGSNWADGRHYCNVWTNYATIHPGLLEPTLCPEAATHEEMMQALRNLTDVAHTFGIRTILDVTCHGVMSYSPLASWSAVLPPGGVVASHPNMSSIIPHPDWFEAISWPDYDQIPQVDQHTVHTRMIDYVMDFDQPDLDDFWLQAHLDLVAEAGVDGFRLDIGGQLCSKYSLVMELRDLARAETGKELFLMVEGDIHGDFPYLAGIMDVGQDTFGVITDITAINLQAYPRKYYTIQSSIHDSTQYGLYGSMFRGGYGMMFTPFLPMWFMGDETTNPYVEAPRHQDDSSLYSHTCNNNLDSHVPWLYTAQMRWSAANLTFASCIADAVKLRLSEPALHYVANSTTQANLIIVSTFSPPSIPAPYIRNWTNPEVLGSTSEPPNLLVVVGNPTMASVNVSLVIPLCSSGLLDSSKLDKSIVKIRVVPNLLACNHFTAAECDTMSMIVNGCDATIDKVEVAPDSTQVVKITVSL